MCHALVGTVRVHRYRAVGIYTVTVKAYNKVGSEQVEVKVKVDEKIQGESPSA